MVVGPNLDIGEFKIDCSIQHCHNVSKNLQILIWWFPRHTATKFSNNNILDYLDVCALEKEGRMLQWNTLTVK